jgi:hypothetical protein
MCHYSILAKRREGSFSGVIKWCHKCKSFHLTTNNIIFRMCDHHMEAFKENLDKCIACNQFSENPNVRNIKFNTHQNGLQMVFSYNEVVVLRNLLGDASMALVSLNELDKLNFN